jgi:hypothetical protein
MLSLHINTILLLAENKSTRFFLRLRSEEVRSSIAVVMQQSLRHLLALGDILLCWPLACLLRRAEPFATDLRLSLPQPSRPDATHQRGRH